MSDPIHTVIEAAVEVIEREAKAVADVSTQIDAEFVIVASLLMACEGKVIVAGVGTSGFIARRAAHVFSVSGTPSLFLHPTEGQHGSVGALRASDVLIVLSKGGGSQEVNKLATLAKQEGLKIIAMTSNGSSALADIADHTIVLRRDDIADPGGLIALGSTLAYAAWLDAMSVVLMRAKQYTWDQVFFTHPGGAVGQLRQLPEPLPGLDIPPHSGD
jgi:D-arabinose 5-phosphate isomerase GutQ